MPLSTIASVALEEAARIGGCHYAIGTNALRRRTVSAQWSSSGDWTDSGTVGAGANLTNALRPLSFLHDGLWWEYTAPTSVNGIPTVYVLFDLTAGTTDEQTTDAIIIKPTNFSAFVGGITVRVRVANDALFTDFTGAAATGLVLEQIGWDSDRAIVAPLLGAGTNGPAYQNIRYARIELSPISGNFGLIVPALSEVVFGKKRQFAHKPRTPWDPTQERSSVDNFIGKSGALVRDVNYTRQWFGTARFKPHDGNFAGVAEMANIEALFDDTDGGTKPFFYCLAPSAAPLTLARDIGHWVVLPDPQKVAPFVNKSAQEIELSMVEQPPFYRAEF